MRFSFASLPGSRPQAVGLRASRPAVPISEVEQKVRRTSEGAAPSDALVRLDQLIAPPV